MKNTMIHLLSLLLAPVVLCCTPEESDSPIQPALELSTKIIDVSNATFGIKTINSDAASYIVRLKSDVAPDAKTVKKDGTLIEGNTFKVTDLEAGTNYVVYAVAYTKKGKMSAVTSLKFKTEGGTPDLYSWETERGTSVPTYSNMALCYGGSYHRPVKFWDQDRFQKHVSYVDKNGKEHWLFDAFLAIEFVMTQNNMDLALGYGRQQADKSCWKDLIDYWFTPDKGFDALDKAIAATEMRIGAAPTKRKVVMVMPDACIYKRYEKNANGGLDMTATEANGTKYWGYLDGRELDFSVPADRIAALKWYIDEVRARWNEKDFQHLEFIGFYTVSEDLAIPGDGWSSEIKGWEYIYPTISYYIHSCHESLSWIPYYKAAGYKRWETNGFDHVQMQPNMFWNKKPSYSWTEFETLVHGYGMSMELEMDDAMLESKSTENAEFFKNRFRDYMNNCKSLGFYGKNELSYYMGGNSFYELAVSKNEADIAMYHEFCQFLIGHIH